MDNISNFLNDKSLIILTSVISSLTTLIVVFLFKNFVLKSIKVTVIGCKAYVKKKYRWHKGRLTAREMIELERRKKDGKRLTKKEEKLLLAFHEQWKQGMSKMKDIDIPVNLPDLSKIKF